MKLKVGDKVYEEGSQWIENEYYPQKVKKIDLKNSRIKVFEKSTKKKKWVNHFFIKKGNVFKLVNVKDISK